MIGQTSNYPTSVDEFYTLYDENLSGYSITGESHQIPTSPYQITLNHYAKTGTITIPGYSEVASSPAQNEFCVTDYAVPSYTRTGITYEIGKTLEFNSFNSGNKVKISYTTPGDKITAALLNWIIDAVYNLEANIGTMGNSKDLEIGNYSTLCAYLSWLKNLLLTHNHQGGIATESTRQLTADSFSTLEIDNSHIATDAAISQSKLEDGIQDMGEDSIPAGSDMYVIVSSDYWDDSQKIVMLTRGSDGRDDDGLIGNLALDGSYDVAGQFKVKFYTDEASLTNPIYFRWFLY